jgi:adenosylcobinamide kinase/adenosylcobinamide-phosphate guanylyltransferase
LCKLVLIVGGAASGKSALGERMCCQQGGKLLYIATMQPYGEEALARIQKHKDIRAGKNFETLECYRDLDAATIKGRYGAVLLECMGNLAANQMFDAAASEREFPAIILAGVEHVMTVTDMLVVISNDVFAGAERYTGETAAYMRSLAAVNRELAARAEAVIEVVAGLPLVLKP